MEKRADSLRSQGFCTIATDIPTKVKLQAAANSQGLTLPEWLRYLANLSIDGGKQGQLPAMSTPIGSAGLASVNSKLDSILSKFDTVLNKTGSAFMAGWNMSTDWTPEERLLFKQIAEVVKYLPGKMAEAIKNAPEQKELTL